VRIWHGFIQRMSPVAGPTNRKSLLDFMLEICQSNESFGEDDAVKELSTFMLAVRAALQSSPTPASPLPSFSLFQFIQAYYYNDRRDSLIDITTGYPEESAFDSL
jgi:hypothetical protein